MKFEGIKGDFPLEIRNIFEYHCSSLAVVYVTIDEDVGVVLTGVLFRHGKF